LLQGFDVLWCLPKVPTKTATHYFSFGKNSSGLHRLLTLTQQGYGGGNFTIQVIFFDVYLSD